jgi:hypothetical protein
VGSVAHRVRLPTASKARALQHTSISSSLFPWSLRPKSRDAQAPTQMELLPKEVERSDQASSPPGGADQHETEAADHREASQTKSMKVRGAVSRAVGQSVLHRQDEEEGLLDKGINMAEKITGIDIDGDGDVGVAGHRAALTKKKTSIEQVFAAATLAQRSTLFHEARHEVEQDAKLTESYWLSNAFMYRAVFQRDGPDAWETRTVKFLQSKPMQTALIILLLLDVLIVFAELFLETEHPSCKVLRRTAYSCCPTELSATDISAAAALPGVSAAHRLLSGVSDGLTGASMGHQGPVELHKRTCQPHTFGAPAYHVGCVMEDWAHRLHEVLGFCSLMILMSFQLEIMALSKSEPPSAPSAPPTFRTRHFCPS